MAEKTIVDYDRLEVMRSSFFVAEAAIISGLEVALRQKADELHGGGWVGRGADKFHNEMMGEIIPAMRRLSEGLNEGGAVLKQVMEAFNAAEEECQGYFNGIGE